MSEEIAVDIEAAEPSAFFSTGDGDHLPMPEGVFIHVGKYQGPGIGVTVRGPVEAVTEFIAHHWGDEEVENMRDYGILPRAGSAPQ
jgi:hypothetical protein